uniref:Zinc finger PMZ-type domain-containing protein n=1 Tax=Lactuca sativa TaxID=4236 RepID=A0A9R1UM17_LACSA|nr:hypothetical protein LSAT_V11C800389420 [Lactuca sativa]
MPSKFVTLLCYRDGKICDGEEGITYNKPPSKVIKVQYGTQFNDLINQIHIATSIDRKQCHIKVICRYSLVDGNVMKYIHLPIKGDNDVEIMFDVLSLHQQLSNIDLYLEVEVSGNKDHTNITPSLTDMILNKDFKIISQFAVVNNDMNSGFDTDNEKDESGCKRQRSCYFEITRYIGPTIWKVRCKLCSQTGCKWQLCACKRQRSDHPNLYANLIAQETEHLIKEQPSISVPTLRAEIVDKFGYTPSYRKFNLGTVVEWCTARLSNVDQVESSNVDQVEFRHVFWAFVPFIHGFEHCRPVISIDATHLYGKYNGKMMIAMGVDGNNQIFSLAFVVVENESYNSWYWFLSHVKKHVVKELSQLTLKVLAYHAGSQNQVRKFNSIMEEIACQWLEGHSLRRWTVAHDGGKRYALHTTNMSEIFNSILKGARFLPIISCVQLTFYRLVHYFDVRRSLGRFAQANGDVFTPHVVAKQAASMTKANAHTLKSFNRAKGIFEVVTQKGKNGQVVDLEKKTYTCGKWKIYKYPCSHVLSTCAFLSLNTSQYIQQFYSIFEYLATWAPEFSQFLMKHIGLRHLLDKCFQIQS